MQASKLLTLICSIGTAVFALIAAYYWYLSSRVEPEAVEPTTASISDYPELHIMDVDATTYNMRIAMDKAAALNKLASLWSAAAALLAACAAVFSIF